MGYDKKAKKIIAILTMVLFLSAPWPTSAQHGHNPADGDWCKMAQDFEVLATFTAFGLGLIPAMQPVALIYGGAAVTLKIIRWANCN